MSLSQPIRLVLFDIDGTLLSAGNSGLTALETAAKDVLDIKDGLTGISVNGNTDRKVIAAMCRREERVFPNESDLERFRLRYLEVLRKEIATMGHLMPGVKRLVDTLAGNNNTRLGLVTGNFRSGAYVKLERFGLGQLFPFGGFGDDIHQSRADLVKLAMERAVDYHKVAILPAMTIVIGDTVHDVNSCAPNRVRCLAVATGSTSVAELNEAGADLTLNDLKETEMVLDWILQ